MRTVKPLAARSTCIWRKRAGYLALYPFPTPFYASHTVDRRLSLLPETSTRALMATLRVVRALAQQPSPPLSAARTSTTQGMAEPQLAAATAMAATQRLVMPDTSTAMTRDPAPA